MVPSAQDVISCFSSANVDGMAKKKSSSSTSLRVSVSAQQCRFSDAPPPTSTTMSFNEPRVGAVGVDSAVAFNTSTPLDFDGNNESCGTASTSNDLGGLDLGGCRPQLGNGMNESLDFCFSESFDAFLILEDVEGSMDRSSEQLSSRTVVVCASDGAISRRSEAGGRRCTLAKLERELNVFELLGHIIGSCG